MGEIMMPPEALSMPTPSGELIARVAVGPDVPAFFWSGRESVRELRRTLALVHRSLDSFASILDFGCGCGRMLLWLKELGQSSRLHGTDIDGDAIKWCRENLPYVTVGVNDADPPLPYPDGSFDLVFNHSVFTHIDARRQDMWLSELQRVTRPGGFVVLSTHGEVALPQGSQDLRDRLEQEGIVFIDRSYPSDFPLPDWYQTTFHAPWYVFEHWGQWFEIRGYVPGGVLGVQDHVLLQRSDEGQAPREPLAARPTLTRPGVPERRVAQALSAARANRAAAAVAPSRFGRAGIFARSVILRVMRPYTVHEDSFDDAVAASITDLARATDHHITELERLTEPGDSDG
jgi:SAM-dependent methyltransferase